MSPPEPLFAEVWHARVFALTQQMMSAGHFTPGEWTAALAAELRDHGGEDAADDDYYHHCLAALEKLLAQKGIVAATALDARKLAWEDAYRRTPHGKPVTLS